MIQLSVLFGLGAALIGTAWCLVYRMAPEEERGRSLQALTWWLVKGVALPLAIWASINVGFTWNLQPFMPVVQAAQNSGKGWGLAFLEVLAAGVFVVGSAWAATTLAWALVEATLRLAGEARAQFKALCWTCCLGMSLPAAGLVWLAGWPSIGLALTAVLAPIAGCAPPILHAKKKPPMYSRAIARMKMGKYSEAEWEIIQQLENCEDDFQGWMMLAELYATHFHDLAEAERTIMELCDQPHTTGPQLSIALHRLADWHLKLKGDPGAARWVLQIICDRLKGSHLAHMAQLRINQLPATQEDYREQQTAKPVPLPALSDTLDEDPAAGPRLERYKAAELANACVEKLKRDPNNLAAREKLARLFAEQLDRADLGIEQITLLLDLPDQPEATRAEWLGLCAAWHLKYQHDLPKACEVLQRLVREFPQTPQALAAQRRIRLINEKVRS